VHIHVELSKATIITSFDTTHDYDDSLASVTSLPLLGEPKYPFSSQFLKPLMEILIVDIFKNGYRNIPSNYRTIKISLILAKLYGIILEKKIILWLESHGKRAKV
jgi:hypothetical protein